MPEHVKKDWEASVDDEINDLRISRPHVVILGAGASYATLPTGDRNGRKLPLMSNLISVLELEPIIRKHGYTKPLGNFEALYGKISEDQNYLNLRKDLEDAVYEYFRLIRIPDEPTIYDHLLLSLRKKDVVATFNWDPLICQAYQRNRAHAELPSLYFLHGNVLVGHCPAHLHAIGGPGTGCSECDEPLIRTKLLYPVEKKNYSSNPFIAREWQAVQACLKDAFMLTIFGYSAPASDVEAVSLLKDAWVQNPSRNLLETEIIDIKPKGEIVNTWQPFLYSHHYLIEEDFYQSWISRHPRRSCEAMFQQTIEAKFIDENPLPLVSFKELYPWYEPLLAVERSKNK